MKITNKLSLAAAVMTGVIATGCSNTSQIEGAAQIEAAVMAKPVQVAAPTPAPKMVRKAPVKRYNRWTHTHPAIPRCTKSVRHTHKYNSANHRHSYGCRKAMPRKAVAAKPAIDVYALQKKLAGKGYYKGPIDGVVGPATRSALQRFMKR